MGKRAYNFTNSEISSVMYGIGILIIIVGLFQLYNLFTQAIIANNLGLANSFMFIIVLVLIGCFFSFISMAIPNYMISKYNLNIFIDKISNPDYKGWLRFTRNHKFLPRTVNTGPLGQTKGMANGKKADVIDSGKYTVTLENGNQCIIVTDFLSNNIDMDNVIAWNLIKKHFGVVGFNAYELAYKDEKLIFKDKKKKGDKPEKKD